MLKFVIRLTVAIVLILLTVVMFQPSKFSFAYAYGEGCIHPTTIAWRPQGDVIAVTGVSCDSIQFFNEDLEQIASISLDSLHITSAEHVDRLVYIEWNPDGRFLAIPTVMSGIVIWDYESHSIYQRVDVSPGLAVWSPNGRYLAFVGDLQYPPGGTGLPYRDTIYVYDVLEHQYFAELPDIDLLDLKSPVWIDNELLYFAGSTNSRLQLGVYRWSLVTNTVEQASTRELSISDYIRPYHWNTEEVGLIVRPQHPDGEVGTIAVWYFTDSRLILRDIRYDEWGTSSGSAYFLWSPNRQYILFSDLDYFAIFDPETMRMLHRQHQTDCDFLVPIRPAAWHPDGDRFVVASTCGLEIIEIDEVLGK
jgi:WD40 repeat protein